MAVTTKDQKHKEAGEIRDRFARASAAVLLDFRGVTVELITELRARFRQAGIDYRVVKNTLAYKALVGFGLENDPRLDEMLVGPTGIAWSYEDPSAAAKVIKAFRKENEANEKLTIKGAILEKQLLAAEKVESVLASMPGKNELRASMLAQLLAPAQHLVRQLAAPAQNLVYVLDARTRQQEQTS